MPVPEIGPTQSRWAKGRGHITSPSPVAQYILYTSDDDDVACLPDQMATRGSRFYFLPNPATRVVTCSIKQDECQWGGYPLGCSWTRAVVAPASTVQCCPKGLAIRQVWYERQSHGSQHVMAATEIQQTLLVLILCASSGHYSEWPQALPCQRGICRGGYPQA